MPTAPHPKAKFIGYVRNRHPDFQRHRVQVWWSPVKPYMVLIDESESETQDSKRRAANDGDGSDDCNG